MQRRFPGERDRLDEELAQRVVRPGAQASRGLGRPTSRDLRSELTLIAVTGGGLNRPRSSVADRDLGAVYFRRSR